jgi:F1F0 ATPase subunit 2
MDAQAMIASHLTAHDVTLAAGWLAAGAAIGAVHFMSLRWNVRMLAAGRSLLPAVAVQLARFAFIGAALAAIAIYFGALPLLAATAGILAARTVIIRLESLSP